MQVQENNPQSGTIELSIELDRADIESDLQKTASKISESISIPGFRPGKAPYNDVCRHAGGEEKIYAESIERIVNRTLAALITEKKYDLFGNPSITVEKATPPFGVSYKAVLSVRPEVALGDPKKIKANRNAVTVDKNDVEKVINQLRDMRASEAAVDRPAHTGDRVVLDFDVSQNKVAIENGSAKDYPLTLGENRFIPGFEAHVAGLKKGEEKTFELAFPKEYHATAHAGKMAEFKIKIKEVYERTLPVFDDAFAKTMGYGETAAELEQQITDNLKEEKEKEEEERFHMACMDALIGISTIGAFSEQAIHEEAHKMMRELEESVSRQGMEFDRYLESIKKTKDDLEKEFNPKATHRLTVGLVANAFRKDRDIKVGDEEVAKELEAAKKAYVKSPDMLKRINTEAYKNYTKNALASRKVFDVLAKEVEGKNV